MEDGAGSSEELKHLQDLNMSCSFLVFVLFFIFCPGALSSQINVTARVGSTAVLPCDCRNVTKALSPSQSPHVEWRTSSGTVLERSGEEVYAGKGYKSRVDVPKDQLLKGDCSLVLNVTAEDEGDYKCYMEVKQRNSVPKRDLIQSVELSVDETTETNDNQRSDSSDSWTPEKIGGVSAGVIVIGLVLLGLVVFILFRRRGRTVCRRRVRDEENVNEPDHWGPVR
ncbi:uncharacterized protein [Hoplias malabaricus]|uniref:uncharacterized protein n=1 Tax=Hoplias malabaricus TaxID=27720 RepID=UPI00346312BF